MSGSSKKKNLWRSAAVLLGVAVIAFGGFFLLGRTINEDDATDTGPREPTASRTDGQGAPAGEIPNLAPEPNEEKPGQGTGQGSGSGDGSGSGEGSGSDQGSAPSESSAPESTPAPEDTETPVEPPPAPTEPAPVIEPPPAPPPEPAPQPEEPQPAGHGGGGESIPFDDSGRIRE